MISKLMKDTRVQVSIILFSVWVLGMWHSGTFNSFFYPLLAIGIAVAFDLIITRIRSKRLYFPSSSIVTGFLIGLIIAPVEELWVVAAAVLLAVFSKQFIAKGVRQHVFNPAAFGIMGVNLLFGTTVSWWATSWSGLPLLILIPGMFFVLWRLKRLWHPIIFLFSVFVFSAVQALAQGAPMIYDDFAQILNFLFLIFRAIILDGTFMLFALVMLPEPITTPNIKPLKYVFGIFVAGLVLVFSSFGIFSDVLLPALLLGNLAGFAWIFLTRSLLKPNPANNT
ncbi:MAG: RnfABCDGE type electron transport complex subunit D [Candidatus Curtissbacteria bacterium]